MRNMQKQRGFTLIELIIVIVILGILAVTAAPKFIDIQGDARAATLEGVKAALKGGSQLVYAKSAIAGEQGTAAAGDATSQVLAGGQTIETDFGYPDAETATNTTLSGWVDLATTDFTLTVGTADAATPAVGSFTIHPADVAASSIDVTLTAASGDSCHLIYNESTDKNTPPTFSLVTGGC